MDRYEIGFDVPHLDDVPRRFIGGVVREEEQDVKRRLRKAQLLTQRPADRAVGQRRLARKFNTRIHSAPLIHQN